MDSAGADAWASGLQCGGAVRDGEDNAGEGEQIGKGRKDVRYAPEHYLLSEGFPLPYKDNDGCLFCCALCCHVHRHCRYYHRTPLGYRLTADDEGRQIRSARAAPSHSRSAVGGERTKAAATAIASAATTIITSSYYCYCYVVVTEKEGGDQVELGPYELLRMSGFYAWSYGGRLGERK